MVDKHWSPSAWQDSTSMGAVFGIVVLSWWRLSATTSTVDA